MSPRSFRTALASAVLFLTICFSFVAPVRSQDAQSAAAPPRADLSRLVVIGDSLSAGYANDSLLDEQQLDGYANLVARRARVELPHPLIGYPGIPNVLRLVSPGPPPLIVREQGVSPGRTNPTVQARNLAVPGARVRDALRTRPNPADGINTLTDIILGLPAFIPGVGDGVARSQIEFAEVLQPTAVFLWIGNNDALGAALAADPAGLTPLADFRRDFDELARRVRAATPGAVVVANIPDVTVVPYLTSADEVALLFRLPPAVVTQLFGIRRGDYVTPQALALIPAIIGGAAQGPLPPNVVLTAAEAATIRGRVAEFNHVIAAEARENNFALADTNALLNWVDRFGYPVVLTDPFEIRLLTTAFLGGLFSLDGVHPTKTGYAIVANEFIRVLNTRFAARILPVNVWRVASEDPLVLRAGGDSGLRAPVAVQETDGAEALGALR